MKFKELNAFLSDPSYLIYERGWQRERANFYETIFTLGNGYLGIRGILDENPSFSQPGTFFSGVYDSVGSQVTELVNAPNPVNFQIFYGGEKISVENMDILKHQRILDLKKGLLYRETLFNSAYGKKFELKTLRFISHKNPHLLIVVQDITSLTSACSINIDAFVDTNTFNRGMIAEGRKIHYHILNFEREENINFLFTKTLEKEIIFAYAFTKKVFRKNGSYITGKRQLDLRLLKGEKVRIINYFLLSYARPVYLNRLNFLKKCLSKELKKVVSKNCEKLFEDSFLVLDKKWNISDIKIKGDPDIERSLRFNIYHNFVSSPYPNLKMSVPAKGLTGEGYRGHIFWDTEIFILPFFIYLFPEFAKEILLYRFDRLPAAREIARGKGYEGAMFAWESADTGFDVTPTWSKDFDGRIIKILTQNQEIHISSDIVYGIYHYYRITGDKEFMLNYGLEIIFEVAKFWYSRLEYNKKRKNYEITGIIGPDEFHTDVKNNAYTNFIVKWTLEMSFRLFKDFKNKISKILKKVNLKEKDFNRFLNRAKKIFIPYSKNKKLLESFEGYFKLRKHKLPYLNKNFLPDFPKKVPLQKMNKTQFLKQPDVLMLFLLFPDNWSKDFIRKNFLFYEERTLHKSSLSPSIHALLAARLGMETLAYRYLYISANLDLKDIYGNTSDGIHMANVGSVWQVVVLGIGGIREKDGILIIEPHLPKHWKNLVFKLFYKENLIKFDINHSSVEIEILKRKSAYIDISIFGKIYRLKGKNIYRFKREGV